MTAGAEQMDSLLVLGTDTGVGKTVVSALLTREHQALGLRTAPFKPIACGSEETGGDPVWADISFLASAAKADAADVGLYRLKKPLSPHLAARLEEIEIRPELILQKLSDLRARYDTVIVEGIGGVMTPITDTGGFLDLAVDMDLPVLIVTRPGLGTLNHTMLTVEACRERGLDLLGLIVNRYPANPDEAETSNLVELAGLTSLPIVGIIPELDISVSELDLSGLDKGVDMIDLPHSGASGQNYYAAIDADRKHVWHPFSQMTEYLSEKPHPLMIVKARGCRLEDSDGRRFIDGVSSLWVNIHGHREPRLDRAIKKQLTRVAHTTLLGLSNEPSALLARELTEVCPGRLDKVFYSDNGSTAVEIALKVAYQYWRQVERPDKSSFVTFTNAYHGDTIGAVSLGGQDLFHSIFKPLLFKTHLVPAAYCYRCPVGSAYPGCDFSCLNRLKDVLAKENASIAAVIIEPKVQGAAGILIQPPGYLRAVADLCREHDVLLIADEVATGFGRTGALFACDHERVEPDILTMAKGITGGYLPLAATLFKEKIYDAFLGRYSDFKTFFHGHTYTGNPLAAAAARENLAILTEPGFMPAVREKADLLCELLAPLSKQAHVGEVRQCGLMVGIELVADEESKEPFAVEKRIGRRVILKARERGIIIRPLGDVVVLMPPPAIRDDDLSALVDATAWAIAESVR